MAGVSTGSEAIKNTIKNVQNAVSSMDSTKKDLKAKYQVAESQWKDRKAKELGELVRDCICTLNKSMKELLTAEKDLYSLLERVLDYEETSLDGSSGGGRPRTRHYSRDEYQTRLENARKDNEAIIEGYRQSLNDRGVPNCQWLEMRLAEERVLMNRQSELDIRFASGLTDGVCPERVYPDYGDFAPLYDRIEGEYRAFCSQSFAQRD